MVRLMAKDQTALGNPNPDFTYSITNNFNYKDFELSIFLNGSYGGKILNALRYQTEGLSGFTKTRLHASANFWTHGQSKLKYSCATWWYS